MSLYTESSILFGSIISIRAMSGVNLKSKLSIMVLMLTLFPVPVAPATRRWGILVRSATTGAPVISLPRAMGSLNLEFW